MFSEDLVQEFSVLEIEESSILYNDVATLYGRMDVESLNKKIFEKLSVVSTVFGNSVSSSMLKKSF